MICVSIHLSTIYLLSTYLPTYLSTYIYIIKYYLCIPWVSSNSWFMDVYAPENRFRPLQNIKVDHTPTKSYCNEWIGILLMFSSIPVNPQIAPKFPRNFHTKTVEFSILKWSNDWNWMLLSENHVALNPLDSHHVAYEKAIIGGIPISKQTPIYLCIYIYTHSIYIYIHT